jgi:hypothetical protein
MMSGMIGQQVGMFQGYGGYAQQIGVGSGLYPPAPPTSFRGVQPGQTGMYGEQIAGRTAGAIGGLAGFASSMVMPGGMAAMGLNMLGMPMPVASMAGGAISAGLRGGSMMAGGLAAGAVALPLYVGMEAAKAYGSAFTGGMQDQTMLNSTLRGSFNFMGGQGAFGRGFSQNQMGQIGSMVSGELRRNPFTSAGELNSLITAGAQAGEFTGVRDVQQFTQSFRKMLDNLKSVQRELGGTLSDALSFVRSSQQAGIFQNADRVNFAAEVRTAEASTGMDRNQLVALAAQGSNISRAFGGVGRQGAIGAMRLAQTLGTAAQNPSATGVSQELLSEVTGGLTGEEAIGATVSNLLGRAGRFSRRAMGRFSTFALSNATGTGLDAGMMERFTSGDISVGSVRGAAHRNVRGMGRARAINREGELAGNIMEQGGLAGQIGMMRLMVGDRVLDADDDLGQLVLQRRFGMSRPESQLYMNLMRNQGEIARQERITRVTSGREAERRTYVEQNSFDSFTRQLEHGLSEATGLTAAREMGRRFLTRVSSAVERSMNSFLGIAEEGMTGRDRTSFARSAMGIATDRDRRQMVRALGAGGGNAMFTTEDLSYRPMASNILHHLGVHTAPTPAELLAREGVDVSRMSAPEAMRQAMLSGAARSGIVGGADRARLTEMMANRNNMFDEIADAQLRAAGRGDVNNFLPLMGAGRERATLAFMRHNELAMPEGVTMGAMMRRAPDDTGGIFGMLRNIGRAAVGEGGANAARLRGGMVGGGLAAGALGAIALPLFMDAEAGTAEDRSLGYISRGGHLAGRLRERISRSGVVLDAEGNALSGTAEDAEMRREYMLRSGYNAADIEEAETRTAEGLRDVQRLQGLRSVNTDALRAVFGHEEFAENVNRAAELSGASLSAHFSTMRANAERLSDPAQRTAALSSIAQMESNAQSQGMRRGSIGTEFLTAVGAAGGTERERAARAEVARTSASFNVMSGAIGEIEGGGELGRRLAGISGRAGEAFGNLATGTFRDEEARESAVSTATGASREMMRALADADPNSEEYRRIAASMSAMEGGRELLGGAAEYRGRARQLRGEGRRGRVGAVDALLGLATGNTFSSMNFHIGGEGAGRRDISASMARRLLMRGGEGTEEITNQMITQLTESGMDADTARGHVARMREMVSTVGRRGGTPEEMRNMVENAMNLENTEGLDAVRARAAEASRNEALARDPVGAEQLRVLESIRDRLPDTSARRAEAAATAEAVGRAASSSANANMSTAEGGAINAGSTESS